MATKQHYHRSGGASSGPSGTGPGDFLSKIKGKRVFVKLNDGQVYAGTFICMDGNLNVVMENVTLYESIEEAQGTPNQTATQETQNTEVFSDVFIRGNNVCYIVQSTGNQQNQQSVKVKKKNDSNGSLSSSSSQGSNDDASSSSSSSSGRNREIMIQTMNEEEKF